MTARKKKKNTKLLASHQRSWLWGRRLILEILHTGKWPVHELHLSTALSPQEAEEATALAKQHGIDLHHDTPERLFQLAHVQGHQGYLARMGPYPYEPLENLLAGLSSAPLLLLLDRIQDSFNFGAIIRSAEVLGADGIIIGTRDQADVNSQTARSSAGAVNRLPIIQTENLVQTLCHLQETGFTIVAADEKADTRCTTFDFTRPTTILLGNEGEGIHPDLLQHCTANIRIPQTGNISSLNVAAAAAILLYEAQRQRQRQ